METSILKCVKGMTGVGEDDESFDLEVLIHTNTALALLTDLGVGPADGFSIDDDTATWDDFLGSNHERFSTVKSYVYLQVRAIFDPPTTSYQIEAFAKMSDKLEWRISVLRESTAWVDPEADASDDPDSVLDGGTP